ncbi:MAG: Ig-like domain-containing protein [Actinomycetota bacterium]|nr:Ig-like domain-containing protein [Actinomycetota bacterium]
MLDPVFRRSRIGFKVVVTLALLCAFSFLGAGTARAADIAVTKIADSGPGSLRQAILDANATEEADRITFGLGAAKTIAPTSALPQITSPLTLDGTTQPGYAGKPLVVLSGANAGPQTFGLDIRAGDSQVKGLVVNSFDFSAIVISGGDNNVVEDCYLGTDATGTQARGNASGVIINDSALNVIGSEDPAKGNVISGNEYGVNVEGDLGLNTVVGNLIGTDATGTAELGNLYSGVRLGVGVHGTTVVGNVVSGNGAGVELFGYENDPVRNNIVSNNFIGTDRTGTKNLGNDSYGVRAAGAVYNDVVGNKIAFNGMSGIAVLDSGDLVRITQNSIYGNGPADAEYGLGIDLGGDGVTPNDAGDADAGPNGRQNFPVLSTAATGGTTTVVRGTLSSTPNTSFRIEFASSPKADSSGYGEGRFYLPPSVDVVTDGSGKAAFTYETEEPIPVGYVVAAVAIPNDQVDGTLTTSEFSKAVTVQDAPPAVAGVTPQAGATGVSDETNVTATFSEALRSSTVDGTTFVLVRKGTSTRVPAVVRYDAERKRAVLNPSEPLRAGAAYVARVRGGEDGVKDLANKPLADTKAWGFTVGR